MKITKLTRRAGDRRGIGLGRRTDAHASAERPATDLWQPAAHGRHHHVCRPPDAASGTVAGQGIHSSSDLTSFPATGIMPVPVPAPSSRLSRLTTYRRLQSGAFAEWRLSVEGRVDHAARVLARRIETASVADADHATYLRGRLDRHWPMDRRAAQRGAPGCRHPAVRQVRGVPFAPTTGWTASTCSTPCTRRPFWPTA